jgi:hypothetical protein
MKTNLPRGASAPRTRLLSIAAAFLLPALVAATTARVQPDATRVAASKTAAGAARWKINTHLFAANIALGDAVGDGMVTIPPYGEIPVAPAALRALREAPSAYRAGVLAPDLFPDMYVGGWSIHSDLRHDNLWAADDWLRHVWNRARAWDDASEKDKVMAFAYGFLTHGAGDMFAHTWVNEKAEGAWVNFDGKDGITARRHIVLEGFVGEHTPPTDLSLDVWPKFVNDVLIKHPSARRNALAPHYKRWLAIYDKLEEPLQKAKDGMNENINDDAPYWMKCGAHPVWCSRKEYLETWRRDINRGLRAMVDSSESLGEALMDKDRGAGDGIGAMTGWMKEWVPKMHGAHAAGEGMSELSEFMAWVGQYVPIDSMIQAEVEQFMKKEMPKIWELYEAAKDPATWMEQPGFFPAGTKTQVLQEMDVTPGAAMFNWRNFAPIYNSVILSKLALLDANGLNELARRAELSAPLVPAVDGINIMLGVFKSMTHSRQWTGEEYTTPTKFGVCGPENGDPLPLTAVCGMPAQLRRAAGTDEISSRSARGFVLYSNPEARAKIFGVVFKGFGPGPGDTGPRIIADNAAAHVAVPGVAEGRRTVRHAVERAEEMLEIVEVMRGKVAGVAPTQAGVARQAAPTLRRPTRAAAPVAEAPVATATNNWGQRCCAKDIAALRAALVAVHGMSARLQDRAVLARLGRKAGAVQIGARAVQANAALTAFAGSGDAASATAALNTLSKHIDALAAVIAGTR